RWCIQTAVTRFNRLRHRPTNWSTLRLRTTRATSGSTTVRLTSSCRQQEQVRATTQRSRQLAFLPIKPVSFGSKTTLGQLALRAPQHTFPTFPAENPLRSLLVALPFPQIRLAGEQSYWPAPRILPRRTVLTIKFLPSDTHCSSN